MRRQPPTTRTMPTGRRPAVRRLSTAETISYQGSLVAWMIRRQVAESRYIRGEIDKLPQEPMPEPPRRRGWWKR